VNWCATIPRFDGPLSRHQKYFLQSRGCGKNPSSLHLKSVQKAKGTAQKVMNWNIWGLECFKVTYSTVLIAAIQQIVFMKMSTRICWWPYRCLDQVSWAVLEWSVGSYMPVWYWWYWWCWWCYCEPIFLGAVGWTDVSFGARPGSSDAHCQFPNCCCCCWADVSVVSCYCHEMVPPTRRR